MAVQTKSMFSRLLTPKEHNNSTTTCKECYYGHRAIPYPRCNSYLVCSVSRLKVLQKRKEKNNRRDPEHDTVSSGSLNPTAKDEMQRRVALQRIRSVQHQAEISKLPVASSSKRSPKVGSMTVPRRQVCPMHCHMVLIAPSCLL